MKNFRTVWLLIYSLAMFFPAACTQADQLPGLTVREGQFYKDGKPFRGIGINYFTALVRMTGIEGGPANLTDTSSFQGLETLKTYEIPFVRFCAGGFFPKDWDLYLNDKAAYFAAFDRLVAKAEKCNIGLIPSLFWYFATIPDLVGDPVDQWGNPDSKTIAFMRQYTTEVVSRYRNSPAIWAWEFGNEYLHAADLPTPESGRGWVIPELGTPGERTARDKMVRKNVYIAYRIFAETVRALDAARPVFSGDAMTRSCAFHNHTETNWIPDSAAEWTQMFLQDNQAMSALSAHFYYYDASEKQDAGVAEYGPAAQMKLLMEISREAGKPLWIGEFGPVNRARSPAEERQQFETMLGLIESNQVPLSALWNFDFEHKDQVIWNITTTNRRAYMLDALRNANRRIK
ncbi:MAG: cellulase family glycosylhydrolase [Kiritimatiellales bacterium]